MSTSIQVCDEVLGGSSQNWQLDVPAEQMTVRELIRCRIYQEVQDINLERRQQHLSLMQFAGFIREEVHRDPSNRMVEIDWKQHFERALAAYEAGKFLLLVGQRQTESLDETVELGHGTQVTFLKLIPLVGG